MISGKVEGIGKKGKGCQRHMLRWAGLPSQRTDLKNSLFKKHVALKKKKEKKHVALQEAPLEQSWNTHIRVVIVRSF